MHPSGELQIRIGCCGWVVTPASECIEEFRRKKKKGWVVNWIRRKPMIRQTGISLFYASKKISDPSREIGFTAACQWLITGF